MWQLRETRPVPAARRAGRQAAEPAAAGGRTCSRSSWTPPITRVVAGANWSTVVHLLATYDEALVLDRAREIRGATGPGSSKTVRRIAILTLGDARPDVPAALAFLGLEGQTGASARRDQPRGRNERRKLVGPAVDVPGGKVTAYDDDVQDADRQREAGRAWTTRAPTRCPTQAGCSSPALTPRGSTRGRHLGWVTGISAPITGHGGDPLGEAGPGGGWDAKSTEVPFFYESRNAEPAAPGSTSPSPQGPRSSIALTRACPRSAPASRRSPGPQRWSSASGSTPTSCAAWRCSTRTTMVVEFTFLGPGRRAPAAEPRGHRQGWWWGPAPSPPRGAAQPVPRLDVLRAAMNAR